MYFFCVCLVNIYEFMVYFILLFIFIYLFICLFLHWVMSLTNYENGVRSSKG
jgi:hypothetical protein